MGGWYVTVIPGPRPTWRQRMVLRYWRLRYWLDPHLYDRHR